MQGPTGTEALVGLALSAAERSGAFIGPGWGGGRRFGRATQWICTSRTAILAGNVLFLQMTETRPPVVCGKTQSSLRKYVPDRVGPGFRSSVRVNYESDGALASELGGDVESVKSASGRYAVERGGA